MKVTLTQYTGATYDVEVTEDDLNNLYNLINTSKVKGEQHKSLCRAFDVLNAVMHGAIKINKERC